MKKKPSPAKVTPIEVEVLPPLDKKEVTLCVRQISKFQRSIAKRSRELIYDIVSAGLYFLKLRELHLHDTVSRRDEDTGQLLAADDGFHAVVIQEFCDGDIADEADRKRHVAAQLRTAQRYMNAAKNAGLDHAHTLADVAKLKRQHALDDKTASELYRLPDKPGADQISDEPPPDITEEASEALAAALHQVLVLRDETEPDLCDANVQRMRDTLERYTLAHWDMISDAAAIARDADHGTITPSENLIRPYHRKKKGGRK